MSYTALYRKFRPDSFDDVKGQDHIVTTLKNQIKAQRIGHAYLFCGTRGTGKTTVAKVLAKAVNCENTVDGSPCGACAVCRGISAGTSMNVIEIDAASNNGVDNIREIREEVAYRPTSGRYKVYIIDEVHMLSTGAFNALLKTLEEPPSYVIFILATTEVHKIPVTILSRCQKYDFKRITVDTITSRMRDLMDQEHVSVEEKALRYIAKAADGSMRDALSLLDQCIAFHLGETLTYDMVLEVLGAVDIEVFSQLLKKVIDGNVTGAIQTLDEMIVQGKEISQFVTDFTWYMRNLLLVQTSEHPEDAVDVSTEQLLEMQEQSGCIDTDTLMRYIRVFSELSNQMRYSAQKRVQAEIALIKLCRPQMEISTDSLLDRLRQLEEKIEELSLRPQVFAGDQPMAYELMPDIEVPKKSEKPPMAATEDLRRIRSEWKLLVGQTEGMFKSMLSTAVPKYNGQTGENKLYVEFSNSLAQNYVDRPDGKELLEDIIAKRYGKTVQVEMRLQQQGGSEHLSDITVEEQLKQNIHFDIVEEE